MVVRPRSVMVEGVKAPHVVKLDPSDPKILGDRGVITVVQHGASQAFREPRSASPKPPRAVAGEIRHTEPPNSADPARREGSRPSERNPDSSGGPGALGEADCAPATRRRTRATTESGGIECGNEVRATRTEVRRRSGRCTSRWRSSSGRKLRANLPLPRRCEPHPEGRGIVIGVDVAPSDGSAPRSTDRAPRRGRATSLDVDRRGHHPGAELRVPDGSGPHPLLMSLHPFTSGAARPGRHYSGLAEAAVARGYVVASPTGSQPGPRWAVPGGLETGADDIGFIAELADHLEDTLCIDRNAEFAAGYSAGAAMAQALSCTMPWRFAAVAGFRRHEPHRDLPRLAAAPMSSSSTDQSIRSHRRAGRRSCSPLRWACPSTRWSSTNAARAGCDPSPAESTPAASVEARAFTGCDGDHRGSRYWEMLGAGHTWAGTDGSAFSPVVGPTSSRSPPPRWCSTSSTPTDGHAELGADTQRSGLAAVTEPGTGFARRTPVGPRGDSGRHHHPVA